MPSMLTVLCIEANNPPSYYIKHCKIFLQAGRHELSIGVAEIRSLLHSRQGNVAEDFGPVSSCTVPASMLWEVSAMVIIDCGHCFH